MKNAVAVIIRREDGKYLMVRRGPGETFAGHWTMVTGEIEENESHEQAVVRETNEEAGLVVEPLQKVWECPTDVAKYILHWWTTRITGGTAAPDMVEIDEIRWIDPSEIHTLKTFPSNITFFEKVLPGLSTE